MNLWAYLSKLCGNAQSEVSEAEVSMIQLGSEDDPLLETFEYSVEPSGSLMSEEVVLSSNFEPEISSTELVASEQSPSDTFLEILNSLRSYLGVPPLTGNLVLSALAIEHGIWMSNTGELSHNEAFPLRFRLDALDYASEVCAELIAYGYDNPAEVLNCWNLDPQSLALLTSPQFLEVGITLIQAPSGPWWCVLLARPLEDGVGVGAGLGVREYTPEGVFRPA